MRQTPRMSSSERRDQILRIMERLYCEAQSQSNFTARLIGEQAGVTATVVYKVVGSEYQELRSKLPGTRRSRNAIVQELRQKVHALEEEIKELKADQKGRVIEAIRTNERLDEENRILRARVKRLENQLEEYDILLYESRSLAK